MCLKTYMSYMSNDTLMLRSCRQVPEPEHGAVTLLHQIHTPSSRTICACLTHVCRQSLASSIHSQALCTLITSCDGWTNRVELSSGAAPPASRQDP